MTCPRRSITYDTRTLATLNLSFPRLRSPSEPEPQGNDRMTEKSRARTLEWPVYNGMRQRYIEIGTCSQQSFRALCLRKHQESVLSYAANSIFIIFLKYWSKISVSFLKETLSQDFRFLLMFMIMCLVKVSKWLLLLPSPQTSSLVSSPTTARIN